MGKLLIVVLITVLLGCKKKEMDIKKIDYPNAKKETIDTVKKYENKF